MSFWRTYYHLVWATHDRRPLITPEVETELFRYLQQKVQEFEAPLYAVNGWLDHIHLVVSIPPKYAVAEVVRHLKGASSHHVNHALLVVEPFVWQRGYGVWTLGESQLDAAVAYVTNQKEHHRRSTTNAWLERTDDDEVDARTGSPNPLREPGASYMAGSEASPF